MTRFGAIRRLEVRFASTQAASEAVARARVISATDKPVNPPAKKAQHDRVVDAAAQYSGSIRETSGITFAAARGHLAGAPALQFPTNEFSLLLKGRGAY